MDDFKQKADELKQFVEDCKVYHRARDRMKALGIHDEQTAIVYLQREIDHYRDKIRSMEESLRFNEDAKKKTHTADLFECMPKELLNRISTIYTDSDGSMSVTLDTYEEQRTVVVRGSLESLKECLSKFKDNTIYSRED